MEILQQIVFWFIVALTIGSAMIVVFHKRIIYSAFALLFTFIGVAALYLYLTADFLAASQLLIYVGGILTLIIFGVFMTSKIQSLELSQQTHQLLLSLIPAVLILFGLGWMIYHTPWNVSVSSVEPTTKALGQMLLTRYLVPFEAASILLLAALIGAMQLTRYYRHRPGDK